MTKIEQQEVEQVKQEKPVKPIIRISRVASGYSHAGAGKFVGRGTSGRKADLDWHDKYDR